MFQIETQLRRYLVLFCLCFIVQVHAKQRILEIQTPNSGSIADQVAILASQLEPTLPAPTLEPEPPFTVGRVNTLYWNRNTVAEMVDSLGYQIVYFEIQALFDDSELFSPIEAENDSATFTNGASGLPEGTPIHYRLRYFAQNVATLEYGMSYWSEAEISIQDILPPVLYSELSGILNAEESANKYWVVGPSVDLRVVASDSAVGKVAQVRIYEESVDVSDSLSYDFDLPATYVDTTISFHLKSNTREAVTLAWEVVDLSGQHSLPMSVLVYSWPPDEKQIDELICFPNPFQPDQGEIVSIKTDVENIEEARIFDLFGNEIAILSKNPDNMFFQWDGKNENGKLVAQGGYLCVIKGKENLYCKIAVVR